MADASERFSELQEWVEAQTVAIWPAVLFGALVLFVIAQRLAQVSATTLRTTLPVILASLVATVSFVISMVALALAVWGLALDLRERDVDLDLFA